MLSVVVISSLNVGNRGDIVTDRQATASKLSLFAFADGDDIKIELKHLFERGKILWCDGKSARQSMPAVVCVDSNSDDESPTKKSRRWQVH